MRYSHSHIHVNPARHCRAFLALEHMIPCVHGVHCPLPRIYLPLLLTAASSPEQSALPPARRPSSCTFSTSVSSARVGLPYAIVAPTFLILDTPYLIHPIREVDRSLSCPDCTLRFRAVPLCVTTLSRIVPYVLCLGWAVGTIA